MDYRKIYNNIIDKRKTSPIIGYKEKHHIIPKCLGGDNTKNNLVELTAKEHFICHLLLTKIYPKGSNEYYKMVHSFLWMLNGHSNSHDGNRYNSSKNYSKLKKDFALRQSMLQTGKGNSQYGKKWISNLDLKICKKIPKDDIIPDGWILKRILNWSKYVPKINEIKQCKVCSNVTIGKRLYCSKQCQYNANKPIITKIKNIKTCLKCDNIISNKSAAKFCSNKCRYDKPKKLDEFKDLFLKEYSKTQSINKSLKIIGVVGSGDYYKWAIDVILQCNDESLILVYQNSKRALVTVGSSKP